MSERIDEITKRCYWLSQRIEQRGRRTHTIESLATEVTILEDVPYLLAEMQRLSDNQRA